MSRRSLMMLSFVAFTMAISVAYYHIYMSLDTMARQALLELGDTTYYAPENQVWVATKVVMFSGAFVGAGMVAMMFVTYLLSTAMCNQEINAAIRDCKKLGGEVTSAPIKVCHWYSYDWSLTGELPSGEEYHRFNGDDFFEVMPFVHH